MNTPDYPAEITKEEEARIATEFSNDQADKLNNPNRELPTRFGSVNA